MLNLTNLQTKGYDEFIKIDGEVFIKYLLLRKVMEFILHITIRYPKINWIRLKIMR